MTNRLFREGNGPIIAVAGFALLIAIAGGNLAAVEAAILTGSEDMAQPERAATLGKFILGVSAMLGGSLAAGRMVEVARS